MASGAYLGTILGPQGALFGALIGGLVGFVISHSITNALAENDKKIIICLEEKFARYID